MWLREDGDKGLKEPSDLFIPLWQSKGALGPCRSFHPGHVVSYGKGQRQFLQPWVTELTWGSCFFSLLLDDSVFIFCAIAVTSPLYQHHLDWPQSFTWYCYCHRLILNVGIFCWVLLFWYTSWNPTAGLISLHPTSFTGFPFTAWGTVEDQLTPFFC